MPLPSFKYGDVLMKGLVAEFAPEIAKGFLLELLRKRKINVEVANAWVNTNSNLWDSLDQAEQESLQKMGKRVKSLTWMNFDWAISALKGEFPAVASLFLGWQKGANWLERQLEIIKQKVVE